MNQKAFSRRAITVGAIGLCFVVIAVGAFSKIYLSATHDDISQNQAKPRSKVKKIIEFYSDH